MKNTEKISSNMKITVVIFYLTSHVLSQQEPLPLPPKILKYSSKFQTFKSGSLDLKTTQISKFEILGLTKTQSDEFIIDLTSDLIITGDGSENWGFNCKEDPGCNILDNKPTDIYYKSSSLACVKANTISRFSNAQMIEKEKLNLYKKLNFLSCKMHNNWSFNKIGVFGLNPQSEFWTYIIESYKNLENPFFFSFYYNVKTLQKEEEEDPQIIGNMKLSSGYINIDQEIKEEEGKVYLKKSKIGYGDVWIDDNFSIYYNGQDSKMWMCIDNGVNVYFSIKNSKDLKENITKTLCKNSEKGAIGQIGCSKGDIREVEKSKTDFKLKFSDEKNEIFNLELTYYDLIYFDKEDKMNFYFNDFTDITSVCENKANVGIILGKLTFSKVKFLVRVGNDSVLFGLRELNSTKNMKEFDYLRLILIGGFCFIVFVFLAICLIKRPRPDKNTVETYLEENSISIPAEDADKFFGK